MSSSDPRWEPARLVLKGHARSCRWHIRHEPEAYGHKGFRVEHSDNLESVLRIGLEETPGLVLIEVVTDSSENVFPTLAPNRPLTEMLLRTPVSAEEL